MLKVLIGVSAALGLSLVLNWELWGSSKKNAEAAVQLQASVQALEVELSRTRANVLLAYQNASKGRSELSKAIQEVPEWADAKVPISIARTLDSTGVRK